MLLTGASSGLGAATARALAASGARLLLSGRNAARLQAVAAETDGIALEADLAAPDGPATLAAAALRAARAWNSAGNHAVSGPLTFQPPVRELVDQAVPAAGQAAFGSLGSPGGGALARAPRRRRATGSCPAAHAENLATRTPPAVDRPRERGIDILINNAGVGWAGPLTDMSAAEVARLVAVNLIAPIELTRLLAPSLAAGPGRVVFISSIAGSTGVTNEAVYAATKAGLSYFAESLRYELADSGVGVSVVVPGVVDTPFFVRRGTRYSRSRPVPVPAQRVARVVLTAIERKQPVAYVPRWLGFPAWLHGAAPTTFRVLAGRFG